MTAIPAPTHTGLVPRSSGLTLALVMALALATIQPWSVAARELEWRKLPDMPVGKWEAGTVVLDDKLYFFGGYTQGVKSSKRSEIFDPKDNSWTPIQELPSAITHMNMVLDGRTVWFAGGYKGTLPTISAMRSTWRYSMT